MIERCRGRPVLLKFFKREFRDFSLNANAQVTNQQQFTANDPESDGASPWGVKLANQGVSPPAVSWKSAFLALVLSEKCLSFAPNS